MDEDERNKRLEALLAIDERIAALEASRGDRRPWWKNAGLVAAYGGLIALVPTSVTGIAGWLENRGQLELAAQRQEHERTLAYLALAVDPESNEAARAQVLRFLASLQGDPVAAWASSELALVQTKIAALVEEKQEVVAEIEADDAKVQAAETQAAELTAQAQVQSDPKVAKAAAAKTAEALHLAAQLKRKRDRIDAISTRIGDTPLEIIQIREGAAHMPVAESAVAKPEHEGATPSGLRLMPSRTRAITQP